MIRPKVLGVFPSKTDAVSYYRSVGVLPYIREIDYTILNEPISWNVLINYDIIFINRPFGGNFLKAVEVIRKNNKKLWLDYDDNFFCIPETNPAYGSYQNKQDQEDYKDILDSANFVTVSTDSLGKYLRSTTSYTNPLTVPNCFNDYIFNLEERRSQNKIVNWRGSNTHNHDFKTILANFIDIQNKYKDWNFTFLGKLGYHLRGEPIKVKGKGSKEEILPNPFKNYVNQIYKENIYPIDEMDIIDYFLYMKQLAPQIQIVPLENKIFNINKSNIAWIEGTYAGAVTIAPNLEEFRKPGVLVYDSPAEFEYILESCIKGDIDLNQHYKKSFDYINENLLLSKNNDIRKQLIGLLFSTIKR
jgi:hypothetical protein